MKKLIFFNRRKKTYYFIEGNSILSHFAAVYLSKNKKSFNYFKTAPNNYFEIKETFYLPIRLARYFKTIKKGLKFTLITENFILPITDNYKKFSQRAVKVSNQDDIEKLTYLLNMEKFKKENFVEYIKKEFSNNFQKILISLLYIYEFYNFDKLTLEKGSQILKDFFSENYFCDLNSIFQEQFFITGKLLENQKIKKIKDLPSKLNLKKVEIPVIILNEEKIKFPENTIFFLSEPFSVKKINNKISIENCKDFKEFTDFISRFGIKILNVEKKFIRSYKGLISKEKDYLGRYCIEPYNPYDLLNSVWRFLNEKKGNE